MPDLQTLPEEARAIINRAARVYQRFYKPDLACLIVDGPAVTGGVIPGFSTVSFQVFLREGGVEDEAPPADVEILVQRELARLDIGPFASIRTLYIAIRPLMTWYPHVPGSYIVIAGSMPGPDTTNSDLVERSQQRIGSIESKLRAFRNGLMLFDTAKSLPRTRLLVEAILDLFPAILTIRGIGVTEAWSMPVPKQVQEIERVAPDLPVKPFLIALSRAGAQPGTESHLSVIEAGITVLERMGVLVTAQKN